MAFRVQEEVAWLQISVKQVGRMHILETLENLVDDVLLMNILENVSSYNRVEVCVHEVKHQVDVPIVLSPNHVLKPNNVFMSVQFLEENDLSEGPLGVSRILESIKVFLKCYYLLCFLINCFPYYTVSSLAYSVIF